MLPYFVHVLPSHTPVFRAELLSSVPNSVTSHLSEESYVFDTLLRGFNISSIGNLIQSITPKYVLLRCQSNSGREWVIKKGSPQHQSHPPLQYRLLRPCHRSSPRLNRQPNTLSWRIWVPYWTQASDARCSSTAYAQWG